jgi:hypothetical protein
MVPGPLAEMLARNEYIPRIHPSKGELTRSRKLAETYKAPPSLLKTAEAARVAGSGVVVGMSASS